jgi:hypothetical protein
LSVYLTRSQPAMGQGSTSLEAMKMLADATS